MGMAARHSWLHTSFHVCCTLQVSATTGHGLGLSFGSYTLLIHILLKWSSYHSALDIIAKIAAGRLRSCC